MLWTRQYSCPKGHSAPDSAAPVKSESTTKEMFNPQFGGELLTENNGPDNDIQSVESVLRKLNARLDNLSFDKNYGKVASRRIYRGTRGRLRGKVSRERGRPASDRQNIQLKAGTGNKESLAEQVKKFQQRTDLRECLLPGMKRGISKQACEGWRRQVLDHSSRLMARVKLDPCKKCRFAQEEPVGNGPCGRRPWNRNRKKPEPREVRSVA